MQQIPSRLERLVGMLNQLGMNDYNSARTVATLGQEQRAQEAQPAMIQHTKDTGLAALLKGMEYPNQLTLPMLTSREAIDPQYGQSPEDFVIQQMAQKNKSLFDILVQQGIIKQPQH